MRICYGMISVIQICKPCSLGIDRDFLEKSYQTCFFYRCVSGTEMDFLKILGATISIAFLFRRPCSYAAFGVV